MSNIPFPNPHDADALNTYLDALAAGKQANPESEVETAAQEFHALASRADAQPPAQQERSITGAQPMHTATLAAPISNRTRRQNAHQPGKSYMWLSAAIVVGLILTTFATGWLNREPANPHDNLAFAPGTAEAIENDVLTPESSPWIADFSPADCTESSGLTEVAISWRQADPQGYGIVGPADSESANAAGNQYRSMRACETSGDAWAYWSEARIYEHARTFDETASAEIIEMQQYFAGVYPEQFMAVSDDLTVDDAVQMEWDARARFDFTGLPIPLDAKLNPDWAVELSDGRIAFPATIMYSADDPAIVANGLPVDSPASTVVMVFTLEDGSWKYDDSLQLCLVNCTSGVDSPLDWPDAPTQTDAFAAECEIEEMTAGEYRQQTSTLPEQKNRDYTPVGTPDPEAATAVQERFDAFASCSLVMDEFTVYPLFTDLGLYSWNELSGTSITSQHQDLVPAFREGDLGAADIVAQTPGWHQIEVVSQPIHRSTTNGVSSERMWNATDANTPFTWPTISYVAPEKAVLLADGRVAITTTTLISAEDRGAIKYEGNADTWTAPVVVMAVVDGEWMIDYIAVLPRYVGQISSTSHFWWWSEEFDDPGSEESPTPTPETPEPKPGGDNQG